MKRTNKKVYIVKRTTLNNVTNQSTHITDLCFSTLDKAKDYIKYLEEIFAGTITDGGYMVHWSNGVYNTFCKIEAEDLDIDYKN